MLQIVERVEVRTREIIDMDVIAYPGSIGGGVVRAEDRYVGTLAERGLAGHFDQVRSLAGRLTESTARVAAGHIEITQRDIAERGGCRNVPQHPLRHQLRGAIGIDRGGRAGLGREHIGGDAVHGRGGGEDEPLDSRLDTALQQVARRAGVVPVVLQRVGNRLGHDRMRGKVQHGLHLVLAQHFEHLVAVPHVAYHQRCIQHCLPEAGAQIVEHYHRLTASTQLQDDVAADVAGAAGNQDRGPIHVYPMCERILRGMT